MIQSLIFGILLLKMLFPAYNFFIFVHMFQWTLSEFFFDFRFSGRKSQSQQKLSTKITYFTIQFRSKNLAHLCTSTHVKLKIICSRNAAKILSHFTTDFSANMFLFGVRKKHLHCAISSHPKTAFLKHFESKCLYISVYSCISNYQNFCSKDVVRFYLVVWGWWEAE